jgi:class 3 adenylate cyclase
MSMSAATILFTDIVSFSRKSTAEQHRLVDALTSEVVHELRPLLIPPLDTPSVVALPTGDGLALAFLHRPNQPWDCTIILRLILRMHQWAYNQSTTHNSVNLRVGVHVGAVEFVTDINGKANVCGDTINYAQRVMDAANARQTLFSDAAFREYIGAESPVCTTPPFSETLRCEFEGPIDVYVKHGLQILVYKLVLNPAQPYWSNDDPVAKHLMVVSLTPLPKEIVGSFSEQIEQAIDIAFIQLTGDRFLANFKEGKIRFSKDLKRFWVFIPDPEVYGTLHMMAPHATAQFVKECIQKWKDLFECLKTQFPLSDLKLGLFKEPPYFGASFINWERPGGKIHVSPYIWNVAAPNCPGYDLLWIGKKPSPIYEIYVEGLRYLQSHTLNELIK